MLLALPALHFRKNSVGRSRRIKAGVALLMGIQAFAFIAENALFMNIQMNEYA